jgi:quercetin dioxygenase-like cupin family protein
MALKHAAPGEVVRLQPDGMDLTQRRAAALVKSDRFEAVRLVLPAGTTIAEHKVDGFFTLHCLEGRVVVEADRDLEMGRGDWLYLERSAPHAVRALEDSALLLTILFD